MFFLSSKKLCDECQERKILPSQRQCFEDVNSNFTHCSLCGEELYNLRYCSDCYEKQFNSDYGKPIRAFESPSSFNKETLFFIVIFLVIIFALIIVVYFLLRDKGKV